jgi:hypothetical protein
MTDELSHQQCGRITIQYLSTTLIIGMLARKSQTNKNPKETTKKKNKKPHYSVRNGLTSPPTPNKIN